MRQKTSTGWKKIPSQLNHETRKKKKNGSAAALIQARVIRLRGGLIFCGWKVGGGGGWVQMVGRGWRGGRGG